MMTHAVEREPVLVEAENRLMVATADDKEYASALLWYRKRRQIMIDGFKGLVEKSWAKTSSEFVAWLDELDRLNPEMEHLTLEEIEALELQLIGSPNL
jgi:hypothetical protein